MVRNKQPQENEINEGKVLALLSYLPFLCIIPLVFKKDNQFVLMHGKQGLVVFVGEIGVFILHIVLGVGFLKLGMFLLLVLSFLGIVAVLKGKFIELPVIASIAEKIAL